VLFLHTATRYSKMPYLHCIAQKCSMPHSKSFPWFFDSALLRGSSTLSHRSIFSRSTTTLTRRCDNCQGSTGALIAGIVIAVLALILALWRAIWIRQQRQLISDRAKINMNAEYWPPAPIPPPAYRYPADDGVTIHPLGTTAQIPQVYHSQKVDDHGRSDRVMSNIVMLQQQPVQQQPVQQQPVQQQPVQQHLALLPQPPPQVTFI
jgi:hypothetical protein